MQHNSSRSQRNSPFPDEVLNITNSFFFENGKDFDATGNRNSVFFEHCTFSERVGEANINRHNQGGDVCNDYIINDPNVCTVVPNPANPRPNKHQACNFVLTEVGGTQTWIWNSYFYRGGSEITLPYPNTLDPSLHFPDCFDSYNTGQIVPQPFGNLGPLIHIGRNPRLTPPFNREKWNYFINPNTSKFGRIVIALTDINNWDRNDPRIEVINSPINPGSDGQNFYMADAHAAPVPMLEMVSFQPAMGVDNPNLITKGDIVDFYTINCRDAAFNMNTDMVYMFRFHEKKYDHEDEIRTASLGAGSLSHQFNQIGITNVNLMAIDVNNNFAASNIVTQQITVMPRKSNIRPQPVMMVVNIKDTYDGRNLTGSIPCRIDRVDDCWDTQTLSLKPCNPIVKITTNFEKFIKINGVVVWHEDVGADDGGWQRVEINIESYVCTDDPPQNGCSPLLDEIEIGLRPAPGKNVDATLVRGLTFYVDDVYIQSNYGYNALVNGDFEEFGSNNAWPEGWTLSDPNATYSYPCSGGPVTATTMLKGGRLKAEEVRSGHYAYWGRIKSLVKAGSYQPGMEYIGGYTYKNLKQTFDINMPSPPRMASPKTVTNPGLTIQPNPASFNAQINGFVASITPNESYKITIIAPDGSLAYSGNGNGYEFKFNASYPPGVYFINIQSKSYSGFKKLVVVN